jgi:hypothetical protein
MLYIPTGYMMLSQVQGPYDNLPLVYSSLLICWTSLTTMWIYLTYFKYKDKCILLCNDIGKLLILKTIVVMLGCIFWSTCIAWEMCSFWIGTGLLNGHLLYEAAQMSIFILIGIYLSIYLCIYLSI